MWRQPQRQGLSQTQSAFLSNRRKKAPSAKLLPPNVAEAFSRGRGMLDSAGVRKRTPLMPGCDMIPST